MNYRYFINSGVEHISYVLNGCIIGGVLIKREAVKTQYSMSWKAALFIFFNADQTILTYQKIRIDYINPL
jgi:hypothetical protein